MIDKDTIDELGKKISGLLPDSGHELRSDIEANVKALVQTSLSKLDLVTREEFDIQTAILQRTREKLDELEVLLKALQQDK